MGVRPNARQVVVIDSVMCLIETGRLPSPEAYSAVTILGDGAGISYGKHQSTDGGGTADTIVLAYIDAGGCYADELRPYLPDMAANTSASASLSSLPPRVEALMGILAKCGRDPVMQRVQDQVFLDQYLEPALKLGDSIGLVLPLSYLVLYDTAIQSGVNGISVIRNRFPASPPVRGGDEVTWLDQYLAARESWLVNFTCPSPSKQADVRKSAYRIRAIRSDLFVLKNYALATPLRFRRVLVP